MICEHCDKTIAEDAVDVEHREDGSYHYDCYVEWADNEQSYWAGQYYSAKKTETDESNGYEWGDPKNPKYIEWVLSAGDLMRDELR
jgi:hypothetical protein